MAQRLIRGEMAHEKRLMVLAEELLAIILEWPVHGYSDVFCVTRESRRI